MEHLLESNPTVEAWVADQMDTLLCDCRQLAEKRGPDPDPDADGGRSGGVVSTVNFLKNLLVGAIVSVYFMATKERCVAHARKITYSLFFQGEVYWILPGANKVTTFSPASSGASCWIL